MQVHPTNTKWHSRIYEYNGQFIGIMLMGMDFIVVAMAIQFFLVPVME